MLIAIPSKGRPTASKSYKLNSSMMCKRRELFRIRSVMICNRPEISGSSLATRICVPQV
jgi:hypothetical protein